MDNNTLATIEFLLTRYLESKTTAIQEQELFALIDRHENDIQLTELLEELLAVTVPQQNYQPESWQPVINKILSNKAKVRKFGWLRYAAAAVVLFAVVTTYLVISNKKPVELATIKDVKAPASNRATIQLANGQTVYLDSANNGQLAMLGNVKLVKLADGQIAYSGNSGEVTYNTISNPRGSKVIDMELTDGSHVWLNAGSSMTYPVPMTGKTRDVMIKGEAYFEVTKDASRPFTVSNGETRVTVLGTHFNVNAYENEPDLKITLLEGSVSVTQQTRRQLLKPGQQAIVQVNDIRLIEEADTEQAIAWKNGKTSFQGLGIEAALRELERWYDITVEISGRQVAKSLNSEMDRNEPLKDVLKTILDDNGIKYQFDPARRKLTVLQ
jgi:transmembrane sensor